MTNSQLIDRALPPFAEVGPNGVAVCIQAAMVRQNILTVFTALPKLLAKLDADTLVADVNYASLCTPTGVANTIAAFNTLLAKLDADAGVTATTFTSKYKANTGIDLGLAYENMLSVLDGDTGVTDTNYVALHGGVTLPCTIDG